MKKILLFLLPLLWVACSNDGSSPIIEVKRLYVNGSDNDYAGKMNELPTLKKGDKVSVALALDGNGSDLKSFQLQKSEDVSTQIYYQHSDVSDDENLTDEKKGHLRFSDGVSKTEVMVNATVTEVNEKGEVKLSFYLSSKAECDGAQEEIDLKTGKE